MKGLMLIFVPGVRGGLVWLPRSQHTAVGAFVWLGSRMEVQCRPDGIGTGDAGHRCRELQGVCPAAAASAVSAREPGRHDVLEPAQADVHQSAFAQPCLSWNSYACSPGCLELSPTPSDMQLNGPLCAGLWDCAADAGEAADCSAALFAQLPLGQAKVCELNG